MLNAEFWEMAHLATRAVTLATFTNHRRKSGCSRCRTPLAKQIRRAAPPANLTLTRRRRRPALFIHAARVHIKCSILFANCLAESHARAQSGWHIASLAEYVRAREEENSSLWKSALARHGAFICASVYHFPLNSPLFSLLVCISKYIREAPHPKYFGFYAFLVSAHERENKRVAEQTDGRPILRRFLVSSSRLPWMQTRW